MKITVTGSPDFKFEAKNPDNGYAFSIGASKSIGGDESGFRPMQLLLAAMASCAGIDVVNILKKSREPFESLEIEVEGDRKEGTPSPFKTIRARFIVHGKGLNLAKAEKAVKLAVEKYCSVVSSLDPAIKVVATAEIKT